MVWADIALLLGVSQGGARMLTINLLTARHGRCQGVMDLAGRADLRMQPGCRVSMTYTPGDIDEVGRVELTDVRLGVVSEDPASTGLLVVRGVSELLSGRIDLHEPVPAVYRAATDLFAALTVEDDHWPVPYVCLEMAVLEVLGHLRGIDRCRPAHRRGEAIYLSPRSGRAFPRTQVGAFLDRLMPVPAFLMGRRDAGISEVRQGLELTRTLFERRARDATQVAPLPAQRREIVAAIDAIARIPARIRQEGDMLSAEARRRLLLSMRPLQVPGRSPLGAPL